MTQPNSLPCRCSGVVDPRRLRKVSRGTRANAMMSGEARIEEHRRDHVGNGKIRITSFCLGSLDCRSHNSQHTQYVLLTEPAYTTTRQPIQCYIVQARATMQYCQSFSSHCPEMTSTPMLAPCRTEVAFWRVGLERLNTDASWQRLARTANPRTPSRHSSMLAVSPQQQRVVR